MTTGQKQMTESTNAEMAERLAPIEELAAKSYRGWYRQADLAEKQAIEAEQRRRGTKQ